MIAFQVRLVATPANVSADEHLDAGSGKASSQTHNTTLIIHSLLSTSSSNHQHASAQSTPTTVNTAPAVWPLPLNDGILLHPLHASSLVRALSSSLFVVYVSANISQLLHSLSHDYPNRTYHLRGLTNLLSCLPHPPQDRSQNAPEANLHTQ